MKSARITALTILLMAFGFNEWAFRFIFPLEPIDSFLRLMTLVLDIFIIILITFLLIGKSSVSDKIGNLLNNHPKKLMLYIGLFLSLCMVLSIEFSCRYYFKHIYRAPYSEKTYWEPSAIIRDSILGSKLPNDTVVSHAYVVNDSLIYKQYYRTDQVGRRINPKTRPDSSCQKFAMVTGCSFAFGYGVNEHQTLAYFLDSLMRYRGYNYAVAGHGTQQTLALLESRNLSKEINEPDGVLIHLFIDDHIPRLIGSRRLIKLWATNYPYYHLQNGELIRDGSFWSGRHLLSRFYRAISQSAFIDLFDIDFPWYVSNSHLELFGAVLRKAKLEFLAQYPNGRFLVVIGPNSSLAPRIVSLLSDNEIETLDCSNLFDKEQKRYKIHWTEAHPNRQYFLELANAVQVYLSGE
ncbi:MAG: hypothetical protein QF371_00035 [Flavobacteriales bacterium]|jgi:hypothetical protein|nr:hypothetical protein [Flavobacteriales bacterium]